MSTNINNGDEKLYLEYLNSDYGYDIARNLLSYRTIEEGFRNAGTKAENDAADWIRSEMNKIGLKNVTKEELDVDSWEFHGASVELSTSDGKTDILKVGSFAGLEGTAGVAAEVVYVEKGTSADYINLNVKGKIVFIDTDAYYSYWYNLIFEEAQAQGAKAIIAAVTEQGPGTYNDDLITIQNIQGFVDIPAVILDKKDSIYMRRLFASGCSVNANIKIDVNVKRNVKAHYVHGMIEGRQKDSYIIYSGHYDAYWSGFLDNATSIGSMLTIAKAMIESGYKPESNIVFVANGAEEFGKMGSAFDYCLGSVAITKDHPEWVENTKLLINFELTGHNQIGKTALTVTGCYVKWFKSMLKHISPNSEIMVVPTRMSGADNIVFAKTGIPTCMNITTCFDDFNPESASNYDHTQYDNIDRYDKNAFDEANRIYGLIAILVDKAPMLMFDFEAYADEFIKETTIEQIDGISEKIDCLRNKAYEFKQKSIDLKNIEIPNINRLNRKLIEINRLFLSRIYKYDAFTSIRIGHIQPYAYVSIITKLIESLKLGIADTVDELLEIDFNYLITDFGKEVYEKTAIYAFSEAVPQVWGENNCIPYPNCYDVVMSILKKREKGITEFENEIQILEELCREQKEQLIKCIDEEMVALGEAISSADELLLLNNNIPDKKEMMGWVKEFTKWPHRMTGTSEGVASAEYTAEMFKMLGLEEVAIEPVPSVCYETTICELSIDGMNIECHLANGTNRSAEIGKNIVKIDGAEVIYLGRGNEDDFAEIDVEGKIVICDCYFKKHNNKRYMDFFEGAKLYDPDDKLSREVNIYNIYSPNDWPFNYLRAKSRGAKAFIGVLHNFMDCHYYHEDYCDIVDIDGFMEIPGLWISKNDGSKIIENLTSNSLGKIHVETEYAYKDGLNVKGIIKGKSDDVLVIHSHHDATSRGGVQDASGMSVVFALAKYFAALPKEDIKTTIMFLSTDTHYTDYEGHVGFIDKREANGEKIIMDFAIEHIGKAMELNADNQIILYDESEARHMFVSKIHDLPERVYRLIEKNNLEKMMLLPVEKRDGGEYQSGDVNSDAYDFNVRGIPVVSLLAAPMYLYHNSDDYDKVHEDSLEPVAKTFISLVDEVWDMFDYR